jgi:hypothetical protein
LREVLLESLVTAMMPPMTSWGSMRMLPQGFAAYRRHNLHLCAANFYPRENGLGGSVAGRAADGPTERVLRARHISYVQLHSQSRVGSGTGAWWKYPVSFVTGKP